MLYVSALSYDKNGNKLWGITDTDDNITEFLSESEVKDALDKIGYTSIKGATYTGSRIKFERTTPLIVAIGDLDKGSTITLDMPTDGIVTYTICGVTGLGDGWYVKNKDGATTKLLKKYLLAHKDSIKVIE